jgi:hypothetical protein
MKGVKLAVAAALLLLLPACARRDVVGESADTTFASTEGQLLPGVFDFPAVPGSTVQTPCNIEAEEQAPGTLCVEFPTADSERIMSEYRRRLMQSGWSEASLPPELAGANLTLEFRRANPSDGCTFSVYPLVYDKTEMPTDVSGGGPSAWAAHRNAPGHQSVLRLAVEKLDYSRPDLVCESSGGAR